MEVCQGFLGGFRSSSRFGQESHSEKAKDLLVPWYSLGSGDVDGQKVTPPSS